MQGKQTERGEEDSKRCRREFLTVAVTLASGVSLASTSAVARTGKGISKAHQDAAQHFKRLASEHGEIVRAEVSGKEGSQSQSAWKASYQYADGTQRTVDRRVADGRMEINTGSKEFSVPVESIKGKLRADLKRAERRATKELDGQLRQELADGSQRRS